MNGNPDSSGTDGPPETLDVSKGSTVASTMKQEYEELLKFACMEHNIDHMANRERNRFLLKNSSSDDLIPIPTTVIHAQDPTTSASSSTLNSVDNIQQNKLNFLNMLNDDHVHRENKLEAPPKLIREFTDTDYDLQHFQSLLTLRIESLQSSICSDFLKSKQEMCSKWTEKLAIERKSFYDEKALLSRELVKCKEIISTCEMSISKKEAIIDNLTDAYRKQRDKVDISKRFYEWKLLHDDIQRETVCTKLAEKHYERTLRLRAWNAWHMLIENKWRERIETACQAKARDVCEQLARDCDDRIDLLNQELETARGSIVTLYKERAIHEESLKKAFMRGVCALNMEAMSMFKGDDQTSTPRELDSMTLKPTTLLQHNAPFNMSPSSGSGQSPACAQRVDCPPQSAVYFDGQPYAVERPHPEGRPVSGNVYVTARPAPLGNNLVDTFVDDVRFQRQATKLLRTLPQQKKVRIQRTRPADSSGARKVPSNSVVIRRHGREK